MTLPRERYTHGHHESVVRSHSWRTVANSAAYLEPHLVPGASVLDVGCGPGTITVDIAARVAPGRVVGMDASPEVIEQAKAFARERGLDNVEFVVGDAYRLGFDDATFDVVHAHQVLQHVSDPVALLREFRRVRRAGGVVAARDVDYSSCFWFPVSPGLDRWLEILTAVQRANGGEPDAGRRLKAWAREAGFTELLSSASIWSFSSEAEREWWGGQWENRILHSSLAEDAVAAGIASRDELVTISRAWREWLEHPDGWFAMPHGEVLCRG